MKKSSTLLLLAIFCSLASYAQTLNVAKLDSFFNSLEAKGLAFGSLSISKNGKIQYKRCIGYSFIDNDKKYGPTAIPNTELVQYQKCLQQ